MSKEPAFWDSSALVPLCVHESTSRQAHFQLRQSLPVAKLVPFSAEDASEEELLLVAAGKMRMPKSPINVDELLKIRTGKVSGNEGVQALLEDRAESL